MAEKGAGRMIPAKDRAGQSGRVKRRIVILAIPRAQELDVIGPASVFSAANQHFGDNDRPYHVELVTAGTSPLIETESGIALVAARDLSSRMKPPDTLLVAGGSGARGGLSRDTVVWLQRMAPKVRRLGGVCTGAFALAEAGLLDGRRATTHWKFAPEFARRFPLVLTDPAPIWVCDDGRYTSAGITAGMDLALALVEDDVGSEVALAVARDLVLFLRRPGGQTQFSAALTPLRSDRSAFRDLPAWILGHLGDDLSVPAMAEHVAMSERSFARRFSREVGTSPARFVERLRLDEARRLLETTDTTIDDIASRCGFERVEVFRRAFRRAFATPPAQYRERFVTTYAFER